MVAKRSDVQCSPDKRIWSGNGECHIQCSQYYTSHIHVSSAPPNTCPSCSLPSTFFYLSLLFDSPPNKLRRLCGYAAREPTKTIWLCMWVWTLDFFPSNQEVRTTFLPLVRIFLITAPRMASTRFYMSMSMPGVTDSQVTETTTTYHQACVRRECHACRPYMNQVPWYDIKSISRISGNNNFSVSFLLQPSLSLTFSYSQTQPKFLYPQLLSNSLSTAGKWGAYVLPENKTRMRGYSDVDILYLYVHYIYMHPLQPPSTSQQLAWSDKSGKSDERVIIQSNPSFLLTSLQNCKLYFGLSEIKIELHSPLTYLLVPWYKVVHIFGAILSSVVLFCDGSCSTKIIMTGISLAKGWW